MKLVRKPMFKIYSKRRRFEPALSHILEFERQKPQLIRSLAMKRLAELKAASYIERIEGVVSLGQLNDDEIFAIPEATIVTITSLYDQQVASGMTARAALLFVDEMRPPPLPRNIDEHMTLEDYLDQKIQQELGDGDPCFRHGSWEHGDDFITFCIGESRALMQRIQTASTRAKAKTSQMHKAELLRLPPEKEITKFYNEQNVLANFGERRVPPRDSNQILAFFLEHPEWRLLPQDMLLELSNRVADRSREWVTYDVDHALEVLVLMAEKSNAISHNLLPICRDKKPRSFDNPEFKLYLFALTFGKLANKFVRELLENVDRLPDSKASEGFEDAKAFSEAALICDRYYLSSCIPAACAWVMKNDV